MVRCELCGKDFQKITRTHLAREHPGWDMERYIQEYGAANIVSDDWRFIVMQHALGSIKSGVNPIPTEAVPEFNFAEQQVVIGSLLANASLMVDSRGGKYFYVQHDFSQLPYMAWKARTLTRLGPVINQRLFFVPEKGRFDVEHFLSTLSHNLFEELAKEFYPVDKKVIPLSCVEKLEPLGLAVWYQDTGCLTAGIEIRSNFAEAYSLEPVAGALTDKFGVDFTVSNGTSLLVEASQAKRFLDIVTPFIHPCMLYKVGQAGTVTVEVTKRLKVVYGHYLLDYQGGCTTSHGHNAAIDITVKGAVSPGTGMVVDFGDIKQIVQPFLDAWDHTLLNNVDPILSVRPTAEVMAIYLAATLRKFIPNLYKVRVYETDTAWAELNVFSETSYLEDFLQSLAEIGEWWQELQANVIENSSLAHKNVNKTRYQLRED